MIAAKSNVAELAAAANEAANEAANKATFGRERSVPGSLETWQSRANKLKVDLEKARQELSAAKALLGDISPGDRLLAP